MLYHVFFISEHLRVRPHSINKRLKVKSQVKIKCCQDAMLFVLQMVSEVAPADFGFVKDPLYFAALGATAGVD